jgi:hypothetical protein
VSITALQLSWSDPTTEVTAPTAYARVTSIHVDAINTTVDISVGLYATAAARTDGKAPFSTYHAWPDYNALLGQAVDVRAAAYV